MMKTTRCLLSTLLLGFSLSACTMTTWHGDKVNDPETFSLDQSTDNIRGNYWQADISYPLTTPAEAALALELRNEAKTAMQEFVAALPPQEERTRVFGMRLDYRITSRSGPFTSVRGQGSTDTGGAHPLPIDTAWVYDTGKQKILRLQDMFADEGKILARLSDYSRKALAPQLLVLPKDDRSTAKAKKEWLANMRQMLDDGTQPQAENFGNFLITTDDGQRPLGLTLVFPPYQVAPYVNGSQQVDVPAAQFIDLLKPAWQPLFQRK